MKIMKIVLLALIVLGALNTQAQKIKVVDGNLDFLKGQKEIMLEYDYNDMAVGKFDKEEDYVAKKVAEYNEKDPGSGDEWAESWVADRKGRFEPKFEELLKSYTEKADIEFDQSLTDAKYTMILKTTFTEPGFNIGIVRKDAEINVEVIFVETANPENKLAVIEMTRVPGRGALGNDYDTGFRIQEAYAKAGKELGSYLYKKALK